VVRKARHLISKSARASGHGEASVGVAVTSFMVLNLFIERLSPLEE
jgi:hypothetical protein